MTVTPSPADDGVLTFHVPERDDRDELARVPFRLDDDDFVLTAIRPKQARLLNIVKQVGSLDNLDNLAVVSVLDDLMGLILTPESVEHLQARFDDDDDEADLDVLEPILKQLVGLWYGRPTGKQPGSSRPPSRTGRRSMGR